MLGQRGRNWKHLNLEVLLKSLPADSFLLITLLKVINKTLGEYIIGMPQILTLFI